eukprot:jgi/Galph1/117/GphlegSOOS_G4853.1
MQGAFTTGTINTAFLQVAYPKEIKVQVNEPFIERKQLFEKRHKRIACWKCCRHYADVELNVTELEKGRAKYFREKKKLEQAIQSKRLEDVASYRRTIEELTARDPLFRLEECMKKLEMAKTKRQDDVATSLLVEIKWLKIRMPQFRLGGLWAGRVGEQGMIETIQIHYEGITLVAVKSAETDEGLARGEVAFRCKLCVDTLVDPEAPGSDLLRLGLQRVIPNLGGIQRFQAEAQIMVPVAVGERGMEEVNLSTISKQKPKVMPQWVPGELIVIDEQHIVFVWLSLGQYILFERKEEY